MRYLEVEKLLLDNNEPRTRLRELVFFSKVPVLLVTLILSLGCFSMVRAQELGKTAQVVTEQLNLRSGPSTSNPVIHKMHQGTLVKILARREGWARLSLADNPSITGWASARYLEASSATFSAGANDYFAEFITRYGTPREQGYLPELDTHFAFFCANGFGLALFRETDEGGVGWTSDDWCVRDVLAKDIDGDGQYEIVYFSGGGGTGSFGIKERHLYWPPGVAEPARGYDYLTLSQSQGMVPDEDVGAQWEEHREMRYGQKCRDSVYTPDWPADALSRPVVICELSEQKTIELIAYGGGGNLHGNANIEEFVKVNAARGFELVGAGTPDVLKALSREHLERASTAQGEALENLSLQSLDAVDTGVRQELSKERQAMIAEWLK
ncbi:SH3 domain-containing protein [Pseudophaeobacter sp.]|uniref:SH3 domain-containing protein n=1 Tax=Pseudophaeobacter sp. TaxID=1971739 RepID=UPI00261C0F9C|nr:SH3 domain-containing protein [Pseudophaeobacter sp.]